MPLSFVKKLKTDEWEKMVDVNIKGVLNGVAAVLPTTLINKQGHIVNISSTT
jgi:NADP-dependent 3-hydroxy acid dehydrogenase YdfG